MAHIKLDNVDLSFPIYTANTRSFRQDVMTKLGGVIADHDSTANVEALKNISLDLKDGDRLGIIGHNGAGKTTLLRLMSGIYPPTSGEILIDGDVTTMTDVTLGMDKEANGFDNIRFRCIMMGKTFAEAETAVDAIAAFSELGDFLNLPVRTYSRGMFMRLAFAISTSFDPDILVLDELIGAGDASFQEKAQERMQDLLTQSSIIVLTSHNLGLIKTNCKKVLWLEKGQQVAYGDVDEVIAQYEEANPRAKRRRPKQAREGAGALIRRPDPT